MKWRSPVRVTWTLLGLGPGSHVNLVEGEPPISITEEKALEIRESRSDKETKKKRGKKTNGKGETPTEGHEDDKEALGKSSETSAQKKTNRPEQYSPRAADGA